SNVVRRIWDISLFSTGPCYPGLLGFAYVSSICRGPLAQAWRNGTVCMGLRSSGPGLAVRNADALVFAADMYGIQLDQLATLVGGERTARAAAARWRALGYVQTARLGPGPAWLWVTRAGLAACGLKYPPAQPALSRLAHIRAVAAARIALEATAA